MTKEDIIRMAHEAGLHLATDVNWMPIIDLKYAQKFAELVATAERENIASWVALQRNDVPATGFEMASAIRARREQ